MRGRLVDRVDRLGDQVRLVMGGDENGDRRRKGAPTRQCVAECPDRGELHGEELLREEYARPHAAQQGEIAHVFDLGAIERDRNNRADRGGQRRQRDQPVLVIASTPANR